MSQIFLYVLDGRTLWVPAHKPGPSDISASVVVLPVVTQDELIRSFYLFDTPVAIVDDPQRAVMTPNGRTPSDVMNAVAAFRERCTRDEKFMMNNRYDPLAPKAQQRMAAPVAAMAMPAAAPSMYGYPTQGSMMQQPGAMMMGVGAPVMIGMHQQHHQQMMMQRGAYAAAPPYGAYPPSPYGGVPQQHHMYQHQQQQQQRSGAGPMGGAAPGGPQSRFQQVVIDKPQPVDIPIEIPKDVWDLYHQPNGKLFCATIPSARITVWLRSHTPTPSNYQRYVHCRGGVSLMMKASTQDIIDSKPVELFDRQLCTHFLAHGYCSRQGCLHVHHSEAQVRHMIAAKHVLLQDTTKREREQMVEDILAKDRAAQSRPKEDFETRYAVVSSMPPTFVSGTPAHLLRGHAAAADQPNTTYPPPLSQVPPRTTNTASSSGPGQQESSTNGERQYNNKPSRITGPIGVASDSESDDSDSSDSDSGSSSDSSSSSESDNSSSSADNEEGSAESKAQKKEAAQRKAEWKQKLKKLIKQMKGEREDIVSAQRKAFKRIREDGEDELSDLKKKEKKEKRRLAEESERKRPREEEEVTKAE